ncbi:MAG: AGE family epimerase/isomerase [Planctomycetota bacterium]
MHSARHFSFALPTRSVCCLAALSALLFAAPAPAAPPKFNPEEFPPSAQSYRRLADQMEQHLREGVIDVWYPRAIDSEHGGFYSHFLEDWSRGPENQKTIVYQARMTWVAAQVAMRYADRAAEFKPYTRHGLAMLRDVLWDEEHGGFFWALDEQGSTTTPFGAQKHLYGMSFGIYGASAAYQATGDRDALELAQRAFQWLDRHGHDARHGGYHEYFDREGHVLRGPFGEDGAWKDAVETIEGNAVPAAAKPARLPMGPAYGYKSMNAHIHLLEALTALFEVWPDPLVRERLGEVLGVVRDRIAVEPGCLNLYFTPAWRPVPDVESFGHDVETAFLLLEASHALKRQHDDRTCLVARRLVDHPLRAGWDEQHGGFFDTGLPFGRPIKTEKVWWTQAEGLNALLMMHELHGGESTRYYDAFLRQWQFIWEHQIDHENGGWRNTVSAEGHAEPGAPKATVWKAAYHNSRALMHCIDRLRRLAEPSP